MNTDIKVIREEDAIIRISETMEASEQGKAPFALILGAGFSCGLVPITRDIVYKSLPTLDEHFVPTPWKPPVQRPNHIVTSRIRGGPEISWEEQRHQIEEEKRRAISFWGRFIEENKSKALHLGLNERGLPSDCQLAYQCAFNEAAVWPFKNSVEARRFLNGLMRTDIPRLNAAHFFLASILGSQPSVLPKQKIQSKFPEIFKYHSAFSRLILTTNFDPFLQVALQLAGRLYLMSDTPDLNGEDLTPDDTDAVHLVYVHGSIHRHAQAHTGAQIAAIKTKNAKTVGQVLKQHAVIVIGYSGWDDVIVEALAACDKFDRGLYWLGLRPTPYAQGAFGPRVLEILKKPGANYVRVEGAAQFMRQLHSRFVHGLPLLDNPIAPIRQKLSFIDLRELENVEIGAAENARDGVTKIAANIVDKPTLKVAKEIALQGLEIAQGAFLKQCEEGSIRRLKSQITGRSDSEVAQIFSRALRIPGLSIEHRIWFLEKRGGIADFNEILGMPDCPEQIRLRVLFKRGRAFCCSEIKDNLKKAREDFSRVVGDIRDDANAPKNLRDLRAEALFCRSCILCEIGEHENAISDLTDLTKNGDDGTEGYARARFNRASIYAKIQKYDEAMADYTALIKSPFRPPSDQIGTALAGRGWVHYLKKEFPEFLSETEAALQKSCAWGEIYFNLGLALLANQRDLDAIALYEKTVKKFPDSIASALDDLKEATKDWLSSERAKPIFDLLGSPHGGTKNSD